MTFDIWAFFGKKNVKKIQFFLKSATLCEYRCVFLITSRPVFQIKSVENIKTHILHSVNFCPKIVAFVI